MVVTNIFHLLTLTHHIFVLFALNIFLVLPFSDWEGSLGNSSSRLSELTEMGVASYEVLKNVIYPLEVKGHLHKLSNSNNIIVITVFIIYQTLF